EVVPDRIAAALLVGEAVAAGGLDEEPFRSVLPAPTNRPTWVAWARDWIHGPEADAFRHWSAEIEQAYRVREQLNGIAAAPVESFASVDDVLLVEVERQLQAGERADARQIAHRRAAMHWARRAEAAGDPLFWTPLLAALELFDEAEDVASELAAGGR